jgi:hypothetical protein
MVFWGCGLDKAASIGTRSKSGGSRAKNMLVIFFATLKNTKLAVRKIG